MAFTGWAWQVDGFSIVGHGGTAVYLHVDSARLRMLASGRMHAGTDVTDQTALGLSRDGAS